MLSPDAHEEACKLFLTWLHRLEEKDKRNAAKLQEQSQSNRKVQTTNDGGMELYSEAHKQDQDRN